MQPCAWSGSRRGPELLRTLALHRGRWLRSASLLLLAVGVLVAAEPAVAQPGVYPADQVKAAFLYHFGTYVQWGDTADAAAITIAVLGADEVADELARFLPGRMIQGRPARMRRIRRVEQLGGAQILFIGADQNDRLREHVAAATGRPVLIVTDAPNGLSAGAMVNFRLVERQVRFEISLPAAEAAGLMLSSRLLSAAIHVETARWLDAPHPRLWRDDPHGGALGFAYAQACSAPSYS